MTASPPPRRKWHLARWSLVLILATFGWSGWRAYAFRSALAEAKALGWDVNYIDPFEEIQSNWKAAFKKETWLDCMKDLAIPTSEEFEQHLAIVQRLNPEMLLIDNAHTLRDLSALEPLDRLEWVEFGNCTRLTNVDGLKNLSSLRYLRLINCTALTPESVAALKQALPNTTITGR